MRVTAPAKLRNALSRASHYHGATSTDRELVCGTFSNGMLKKLCNNNGVSAPVDQQAPNGAVHELTAEGDSGSDNGVAEFARLRLRMGSDFSGILAAARSWRGPTAVAAAATAATTAVDILGAGEELCGVGGWPEHAASSTVFLGRPRGRFGEEGCWGVATAALLVPASPPAAGGGGACAEGSAPAAGGNGACRAEGLDGGRLRLRFGEVVACGESTNDGGELAPAAEDGCVVG